jgi:hypothetical protein
MARSRKPPPKKRHWLLRNRTIAISGTLAAALGAVFTYLSLRSPPPPAPQMGDVTIAPANAPPIFSRSRPPATNKADSPEPAPQAERLGRSGPPQVEARSTGPSQPAVTPRQHAEGVSIQFNNSPNSVGAANIENVNMGGPR